MHVLKLTMNYLYFQISQIAYALVYIYIYIFGHSYKREQLV